MNTISIATAAVTGARHRRVARNGQDAVAAWRGAHADGREVAVVVVCDGCSSGASSEVGARLGGALFACELGRRLRAGQSIACPSTWEGTRASVIRVLEELVERMPGEREETIGELLLFTVVAAALSESGDAAVWALGDGTFALDGATQVLGPFADNEPPYLAYDLLGDARPAHFEIGSGYTSIVVASDGACELPDGIARFAEPRFVEHPDALRRELAVLARSGERIAWDERRVVRTPAALQDDCAVGVLRRRCA